ncbi:MAG: alpha mannosidase-like protein [Chaenotheca gracillima]|nr:MAG: alpha mannosidase-like protein [Chaenotheca gracillima]
MSKPILLHLGDPIQWNHDLYKTLEQQFDIVINEEPDRASFIQALKDDKYGQFVAMYRPFWNTGAEMGNWDAELIGLLPASTRIYASAGAGYDWVDTKSMAEKGIVYCNSAAACTEAVADAAIWLMLSTFRNFTWSSLAARSTDAAEFMLAHRNVAMKSHNPQGHLLGIIGLGNIGYRVAQKAQLAFGMKILYHDVLRKSSEMESSVDAVFYETLDEMLEAADCIILATPFAGTKVLNDSSISKMKHGSRLVNIARGKLVDEEALVSALENGQLSSAGLDVHYDEPQVNPKLAKMQNVELLSHTAGASVESHVGFERLGMENILAFFERGKALTPVNAHLFAK